MLLLLLTFFKRIYIVEFSIAKPHMPKVLKFKIFKFVLVMFMAFQFMCSLLPI